MLVRISIQGTDEGGVDQWNEVLGKTSFPTPGPKLPEHTSRGWLTQLRAFRSPGLS